jgi:hypothetical protein
MDVVGSIICAAVWKTGSCEAVVDQQLLFRRCSNPSSSSSRDGELTSLPLAGIDMGDYS